MWQHRQNALLTLLNKYKGWIFTFVVVVALFELGAGYFNHIQNQNTWKSIASLLRNEVNSANSYQISRSLSDMETENWIKCVNLVETSNGTRIFYDTTTKSYCGFFTSKTEGTLSAINGSTWQLSFSTPVNMWFLIVRLFIPILSWIILNYIYRFVEHQKNLQEAIRLRTSLEKNILLDLTKQTRHDIASPIGALKLVIQRIDVAPEYSEILHSIVERIDGIFSQLNNVGRENAILEPSVSLETVALEKLIKSIVNEKTNEWKLEGSVISTKISDSKVIGNNTELSRILSNLLNNSLEARKKNVLPKIDIEVIESKTNCCIRVIDNGIGMDEEVLERVGTKGFSFGKGKTNSGIGLYNAIKTIQSFGGDIKISSKFGVGTTVSIYLKYST